MSESNNTLEYGVVSPDYLSWLDSATANDGVNSNPLVVDKSNTNYIDLDGIPQNLPSDIYLLANYPGDHTVRFRVVDERLGQVSHIEEWDNAGESISLSAEREVLINVVVTEPNIEVFYHEPRNGLSADNESIQYLVDLNPNISEYEDKYAVIYPDDFEKFGEFTSGFIINPAETDLESGKLYYRGKVLIDSDQTAEA